MFLRGQLDVVALILNVKNLRKTCLKSRPRFSHKNNIFF